MHAYLCSSELGLSLFAGEGYKDLRSYLSKVIQLEISPCNLLSQPLFHDALMGGSNLKLAQHGGGKRGLAHFYFLHQQGSFASTCTLLCK
jgi:hypothetical protein